MIKAVIFDMDGLMIDSEQLQSQSFEQVIRELGKEPILLENGLVQKTGVSAKDNWIFLKEKHKLDEDIETLINKKVTIYPNILKSHVKPMKGLLELLDLLKNNKLKVAIATSSHPQVVDIVLSELQIEEYFDIIVTALHVKRGKPHPDIFLHIVEKLKIKREECLVLEDAENGVVAAHAAGMKVISIPNPFTKNHNFSKANKVVNSLQSVTMELINSL